MMDQKIYAIQVFNHKIHFSINKVIIKISLLVKKNSKGKITSMFPSSEEAFTIDENRFRTKPVPSRISCSTAAICFILPLTSTNEALFSKSINKPYQEAAI